MKGQVREDQVLVESDLVFWDHRGVQILRDLRGYSARSYLNFQANCVRRRFPWTEVRLHMFVVCLFVQLILISHGLEALLATSHESEEVLPLQTQLLICD